MLSSSSKKDDDKAVDTDNSYVFAPPAISLPKGGGAIKGVTLPKGCPIRTE